MTIAQRAAWQVVVIVMFLPRPAWSQAQGSKIDPEDAVRARDAETPAPNSDEPYPQHRLVYSNLIAGRVNPIGLENQIDLSYRYRLYNSAAPILRESYVGLSFTPSLSPAIVRLGATLEVRPLSILMFSAGYYASRFFGLFGFTQDFDSPSANFSDSAIRAGDDRGEAFATGGREAQLRGQLLLKFGTLVVRNDMNAYWTKYNLPGESSLYYHIRLDLLMPNGGWGFVNDSDILHVSDSGLVLGVRASVSHAFYRDSDYLPGEAGNNPNSPTVRVGPMFAYRFWDRPGSFFNRPTLLVIAQWWLDHRFRTGQDVSQALPYLVVGFSFTGDVWSSR